MIFIFGLTRRPFWGIFFVFSGLLKQLQVFDGFLLTVAMLYYGLFAGTFFK